jgi:hypothetical protein
MTFIEVLLLIQERGEKILHDKTFSIQTDKFLYTRTSEGIWEQKSLPPTPEEKFAPIPPEPPKEKKKK